MKTLPTSRSVVDFLLLTGCLLSLSACGDADRTAQLEQSVTNLESEIRNLEWEKTQKESEISSLKSKLSYAENETSRFRFELQSCKNLVSNARPPWTAFLKKV